MNSMITQQIDHITLQQLSTGYSLGRASAPKIISDAINITIGRGRFVMLMGPNGCGKSTLMRTLIGEQKAIAGQVLYDDKDINQLPILRRALLVSIVLTGGVYSDMLRVGEVVRTGRYPYTGFRGKLSPTDLVLVAKAITRCGLDGYELRYCNELSDGERQRAMIARAIAQETPVMLLDEPTAHLDIPNRWCVCEMLQGLAHGQDQKIVIMSTHELDLAMAYADEIWLMDKQGKLYHGAPDALKAQNLFEQVFETDRTKLFGFSPSKRCR